MSYLSEALKTSRILFLFQVDSVEVRSCTVASWFPVLLKKLDHESICCWHSYVVTWQGVWRYRQGCGLLEPTSIVSCQKHQVFLRLRCVEYIQCKTVWESLQKVMRSIIKVWLFRITSLRRTPRTADCNSSRGIEISLIGAHNVFRATNATSYSVLWQNRK